MKKLICMSFDGEFVTEGEFKTIEECWKHSEDMGSRWFFYPWHFVLSDSGKTIIDTPEIMEWAKGIRLNTLQRIFNANSKRKDLENADVETFTFNMIIK